MAAYVIVDIDVTNPEAYEEYRKLVPPLVEKYGGKYLVRGGASETLERDWTPKRLAVLEFESVEKANQFYHSADYKPVRQMRIDATNSKLLIVEGI